MKSLEKFFDVIGEILAVLLVIVYVVSLANAQWHFLDGISWLTNIMAILRTYGALLLVAVVGLEAMSKRNIIFRLLFYAAVAIIVIFMFFPNTYTYLIGLVA
ncbi:MAG: hypothetical protein IKC64_00415 [Clostridia bacterium]|nr:hypothetical protein [Clostridia bacterium]